MASRTMCTSRLEIAASLMDLSVEEEVLSEVLKARPQRATANTVAFTNRAGMQRAAIVERKTVRRPMVGRRVGV